MMCMQKESEAKRLNQKQAVCSELGCPVCKAHLFTWKQKCWEGDP